MATDINNEVEESVVLQPQVSQTASKTAEARRSQFFDRINQMTKLVEIPPFFALPANAVAATGPPVNVEDRGSPAVAVLRQICAAGDQPGDQACRDFADQVHAPDEPFSPIQEEIHEVIKLPPIERFERTAEHIVQVPVPLTFDEVAEVVKAVKNVPQERISERKGEQTTGTSVSDCAADRESPASAVPDQPGDQARRDFADTVLRQGYCRHAGGDTTTGPSDSDLFEDCGSPAGAVHRQSCECASDHADHEVAGGDVQQGDQAR